MFSEPLDVNLGMEIAVLILILAYVLELVFLQSSMNNRMMGFNITTIIVLLAYSLPWTNPSVGSVLIVVAWILSVADIFHHKKDNYTFLAINWLEFILLSVLIIAIAVNMIKAI